MTLQERTAARMPGSLSDAMRRLPVYFRPERAGDGSATVHVSTVGPEPGNWLLTVRDGKCRVDEGSLVNVTATINAPSDVWLEIIRRETDVESAVRRGELAFSGDIGVLRELEKWFD